MNGESAKRFVYLITVSTTADRLFGNDDSIPFPSQRKRPFTNIDHRGIHRFEQSSIDNDRSVIIWIGTVFAHAFQEGIFVFCTFRIAFFVNDQSIVGRLIDQLANGIAVLQLTVGNLFEKIQGIVVVDVRWKNEFNQRKNIEREKRKDLEEIISLSLPIVTLIGTHEWTSTTGTFIAAGIQQFIVMRTSIAQR